MSAPIRLRDTLPWRVPWWLSDRPGQRGGKTVGFRVLWALVSQIDDLLDAAIQALQAPWPGVGTPTALPLIGRTRGILKAQDDTDDSYAARLLTWIERWRIAGSSEAIARSIHEYLSSHPKVRVISRSGVWVTIDTDGTLTRTAAAWDWDSVSNPERAGHWWDIFVVVYTTSQWPFASNWGASGKTWGHDTGIGHLVTREEYDAIKGQIEQWKSAHTYVRAVIWTSDASRFDPATPASCPDGTWGQWSLPNGNGSRVRGGRDLSTCRYWET